MSAFSWGWVFNIAVGFALGTLIIRLIDWLLDALRGRKP